MKNSIICLVLASIIVLAGIGTDIQAQSIDDDDNPFWYVSHYKVPWSKVDSLNKLVKKYTIPVVEESKSTGTILEYNLLIHHTGDEYNVVIMRLVPSWDDLDEDVIMPAMEKIIPDEDERQRINEAFNWIFEGTTHKDNIYRDITYSQ